MSETWAGIILYHSIVKERFGIANSNDFPGLHKTKLKILKDRTETTSLRPHFTLGRLGFGVEAYPRESASQRELVTLVIFTPGEVGTCSFQDMKW